MSFTIKCISMFGDVWGFVYPVMETGTYSGAFQKWDFYYDNRNESFKVHFKRRAFDIEKLLPSRIDFEMKNA